MCGFVGFTGRLENKKAVLNKMMERIIHRGPDMAGDYIDDDVALGFRRLSILDLSSSGSQPMQSDDGSVAVVFNGEIYNFMTLRDELERLGHRFNSRCDTEVLLHCYLQYGEQTVNRLRGMFAFMIWDKNKKKLFGARDYFGIKPFYYTRLADGSFAFASEIKSFLEHPGFVRSLNEEALLPYLSFQYSAMEETFFKGVFKLPPAHTICVENGKVSIERYWRVDFNEKETTLDRCAEDIDRTVRESVELHRISDVKVGSFLSGGVDSSYITAALMPDKTFSVGFDYHKFNETDYAGELSDKLGISNYKKLISADECFDAFADIQYHMDEPQSNPSAVPLYFLAKLASEQVTVVLSGEGADEIYAGYEWYDVTPRDRKYRRIPQPLRIAAAAVARRLPYFKGHDFIIKNTGRPEDYFIGQALVFPEREARSIVRDKYRRAPGARAVAAPVYAGIGKGGELEKKQYLDLNLWLPGDILLKADKMSMAHSLELRVPFLDRVVMEQAQTIPSGLKINGKNTKFVFRRAANKTLPDEWADRKKLGFPVPVRYWLCEDKYYSIVKSYFTSEFAGQFFDTGAIMKLLDEHKAQKKNNGRKIWTVFTFLVWYKRFFIDEK